MLLLVRRAQSANEAARYAAQSVEPAVVKTDDEKWKEVWRDYLEEKRLAARKVTRI